MKERVRKRIEIIEEVLEYLDDLLDDRAIKGDDTYLTINIGWDKTKAFIDILKRSNLYKAM